MPEELFSVPRVAQMLDITKKRTYQMVREGKLDAVRMTMRSMRITRSSIDRFIDESRRRQKEELGLDLQVTYGKRTRVRREKHETL
jgi:excisionase family DNA binding protein